MTVPARKAWIFFSLLCVATLAQAESLPPGYVQGDVVSYSYVPIKSWTLQEGIGILPYLFEYGLTLWDNSLENYHDENVRRIDIVSQWSTAIGLSNRESDWRDEVINLMIRCFRNRQLIILAARPGKHDYHQNMIDILDYLWSNRDTVLADPEGDQATGRQLINNILAADVGDEEECSLRTAGLQQRFAEYDQDIRLREKDGQYPFSHIRCWFNMLHYGLGCHASSQEDVDNYGRFFLPTNTKFIGVDTYEYWSLSGPDPLTMTSAARRSTSDAWQNIITRYYPQGLTVWPCSSWAKECRNDTHALFNGLPAAGANQAMMIYIANSHNPGSCHTTPIETMDAFYDSLKAGPWVGLTWYVFEDYGSSNLNGTIRYVDKTLTHFGGEPYTQEQLDDFHDRFVASRMRMFNDVVYNQFGYLNAVAPVINEVSPDPESVLVGAAYDRQLTLATGTPLCTWSVVTGPAGLTVDANGYVSGWLPNTSQANQTITITVWVSNSAGSDEETWQVLVEALPPGVVAFFPFNTDAEDWTLDGWRAGSLALGTMEWTTTGGLPAGHLHSAGTGITNSTDNCTREGGLATRQIPTVGHEDIRIEYDLVAELDTPPSAGCDGTCGSEVLESSCEDKLAVYYSTTGTGGPWTLAQVLVEGTDLPFVWTHKLIDLTAVPAVANNPDFALRFQWQFNTANDTGRLDNIIVRSSSLDINTAPQVEAGADQEVILQTDANLDGMITDDHLPNPPCQVTVTWSKQSGPGMVTFGNIHATDTTASFSQIGTYVLRLDASDSELSASDTVTVTVRLFRVPDFDQDSDVDLEDFGHFQSCLGGSGILPCSGCADADLDNDNDVDQVDFTYFKSCLGGDPSSC